MYRPSAVARGGLIEDFPEAAVPDAERVGVTRDEFLKYWAAHWILPSVTQAFEMFHRDVISEEELRGFLRTQDIAPGWRDELVSIAYNVISRVDIRRMYREGIVNEAEVTRVYLDEGYTPQDAERLTRFAVADATADARELTKAEVLALYEAGGVEETDVRSMLSDLGYGAQETDWLLLLAAFRRHRRFRDLAISRVRSRYSGRRISKVEASGALDRLEVPPAERDTLIDTWDAERDVERPRLSAAMIGGMYKSQILTEEDARVRWVQLGYRSDDVDLLVLRYSDGDPDAKSSGPKQRQLTKSDIGKALRDGTISVAEAIDAWTKMGYTDAAAYILANNYLPGEET